MTSARESVTIPVAVDLENLAHGLVNTLGSQGVQAFIFQLVSLRDNAELDRELAEELGTPYDSEPDVNDGEDWSRHRNGATA